MARVYADLVKAGRKKFSEVPASLKNSVREILKAELSPEEYRQITGENYVA